MERLVHLVLLFFAYSALGWCIEVTLKYFQYHRFINRGFFTGPILPIYGSGAALITIAVQTVSIYEHSYGTTFLISFVLCGLIEYLASYFMEKRYHARWWDYSQKPMNLHGRIWIGNLILFGLGGVGIVHIFNPLLFRLFDGVPLETKEILAAGFLALFAADYVVTHFVLKLVKTGVEHSEADNTEEISREIRLLLSDRSVFHRRFADAYPEVIYKTERITARLNAVKAETERLRREAEQRVSEVGKRLESGREQVRTALEPSSVIKSDMIEKQDALIGLLYNEATATAEMRALKKEIEEKRDRLNRRRIPLPGRR